MPKLAKFIPSCPHACVTSSPLCLFHLQKHSVAMETLAAVSLATSVVQFVDFAFKILSKGRQYHRSLDGPLKENIELEAISEGLNRLSNGLSSSSNQNLSSPMNEEKRALHTAALECGSIARELSAAVAGLRVVGNRSWWKSFRHALKSQWNKNEIEAILKRLQQVRDDLVVHLLVVIQ